MGGSVLHTVLLLLVLSLQLECSKARLSAVQRRKFDRVPAHLQSVSHQRRSTQADSNFVSRPHRKGKFEEGSSQVLASAQEPQEAKVSTGVGESNVHLDLREQKLSAKKPTEEREATQQSGSSAQAKKRRRPASAVKPRVAQADLHVDYDSEDQTAGSSWASDWFSQGQLNTEQLNAEKSNSLGSEMREEEEETLAQKRAAFATLQRRDLIRQAEREVEPERQGGDARVSAKVRASKTRPVHRPNQTSVRRNKHSSYQMSMPRRSEREEKAFHQDYTKEEPLRSIPEDEEEEEEGELLQTSEEALGMEARETTSDQGSEEHFMKTLPADMQRQQSTPKQTQMQGTAKLSVTEPRESISGQARDLSPPQQPPRSHHYTLDSIAQQSTASAAMPRIIHQSWKTEHIPLWLKPWQESWRQVNNNWQYVLWTDEMNRQLVEKHYNWFLSTYDNFPPEAAGILRADSARYLYMHYYGGVYADLDFRALQPMEKLLNTTTSTAYIAAISDEAGWDNNLPNAWLASTPGHPFWLMCIVNIIKAASVLDCHDDACLNNYNVEKTTGPVMLFHAVEEWLSVAGKEDAGLEIIAPGVIYPVDWRKQGQDHYCNEWPTTDENSCYERFPGAYAITYWSHTWGDQG